MKKLLLAAVLFLSLSVGAAQASADSGTTTRSSSAGGGETYLTAGVTWE